jgi:hypothetical protein
MNDTVRLLLFLLGYVVLMKWLLPWLGVPTCMSEACSVAARRKRGINQESELAGSRPGKPTPER